MPRNSSGIYTLPVAAFVAGTVIKSADMNSNLSDIATALTGSIASNGVTSITAPIAFVAGTVTVPGITFAGDTNTGFYLAGTHSIGFATNGINAASVSATGVWTLPVGLTVPNGAIFTFGAQSYSFSSASAANAFLTALAQNFVITITIDGGGSVPSTGVKSYYVAPNGGTVIQWVILADQSGSAVVDVTKSTIGGFPPSSSIAGSAKPTLSSQQINNTSTLTGWTTTFAALDVFGFNLQSVTTCQRIQVFLLCTRTTQ